jgi:hypothetical protein
VNFGEKGQPQLAQAIGIEQSYLSKLENDQSILKAFAIGVFRDLRQTPEVANHVTAQVNFKVHNIKKWLYLSAAACVLGGAWW